MEGKLTQQSSLDDNVEEIIQRCKQDKEKAILEGKYKKDSFKGEIPADKAIYQIPSNWKWLYISDSTLFQEGPGILAVDFRKQGVPLIRISGLNNPEFPSFSQSTSQDCSYKCMIIHADT